MRRCSWHQWRQKIVEFRGSEARKRAVLPCFSPANIELLLQRIHSMILCCCLGCTQRHFHQIQTNDQLLHFFYSYTCLLVWLAKNNATVTCDQITALTELSYSKLWVNSLWGTFSYYNLEEQVRSVEKQEVQVEKASWSSSFGVYGSNIKRSSYFNKQSVL